MRLDAKDGRQFVPLTDWDCKYRLILPAGFEHEWAVNKRVNATESVHPMEHEACFRLSELDVPACQISLSRQLYGRYTRPAFCNSSSTVELELERFLVSALMLYDGPQLFWCLDLMETLDRDFSYLFEAISS